MQKCKAFKLIPNTHKKNQKFGIRVKGPRNLELNQGHWTVFHNMCNLELNQGLLDNVS